MLIRSQPRWWRIALTAGLVLSLTGGSSAHQGFDEAYAQPGAPALTFQASAISPTVAEVSNSGRGQYYWLEVPPDPVGWAAPDVYFRDQIQWGKRVERVRGTYDFAAFDRGLEMAASRGGRFSFRVMAFCPGCGGNLAPSYVPIQSSGAPNWNSEEFLSGWEGLMAALGRKYNKDPRLGYLDIGGYGAAGEWYFESSYGSKITEANARRVMSAAIKAFPDKPKMINWIDGWPEVAASLGPKVGIRVDCIGGSQNTYLGRTDAVNHAWKTAPMVGEWCPTAATTAKMALDNVKEFHLSHLSSGNHQVLYNDMSPDEQRHFRETNSILGFRYSLNQIDIDRAPTAGTGINVTMRWSNGGVAPTYDEWTPALELQDSAGRTVWREPIPIDLRTLTEGTRSVSMQSKLPSSLRGLYTLAVVVTDPSGYLRPMALAQADRTEPGAYALGTLSVKSARGAFWAA